MNQTALAFFALTLQSLTLAACGSSSPNKGTPTGGGEEGGTPAEAGAPMGPVGPPAWADAGAPITGASDMTWTWVDVPTAKCRNGSATGFWVNPNSASKKLMIFLEGGGACFNSVTCSVNPASASGGGNGPTGGSGGILNRGDMANPVNDWNFVDLPYCSGDVFAGNNPNAMVPGAGAQQFVGYLNVAEFLKRIVPTFPNVTQVLLTGVSAGGFGSTANYGQVARAFDPVPVTLLDDSGPPMRDPYFASCLQQEQVTLWGMDKTILAECGSDCPNANNFPVDAMKHGNKQFPNAVFGLVEAQADQTIRMFFAFGLSNCTGSFTTNYPPQMFSDGLNDMRMQLSSSPNFGAYIFNDTRHTTIAGTFFDTQTAGGVMLTDWITQLVNNGKVSNVGP